MMLHYAAARLRVDLEVNLAAASSRSNNSRNTEDYWKAAWATAIQLLLPPNWNLSVGTEHDIWLDLREELDKKQEKWTPEDKGNLLAILLQSVDDHEIEAKMQRESTSRQGKDEGANKAGTSFGDDFEEHPKAERTIPVASSDLLSCRPDLVVLFNILAQAKDDETKRILVGKAAAIIAELKRAVSRKGWDLETGEVLGTRTGEAILTKIIEAIEQVEYQGAIYLRTRMGRRQKVVLLLAISGRYFAYAFMTQSYASALGPLSAISLRLADLEEIDKNGEEEEADEEYEEDTEGPQEKDTPLKLPNLPDYASANLPWHGVYDLRDPWLGVLVARYSKFCEITLQSIEVRDPEQLVSLSHGAYQSTETV